MNNYVSQPSSPFSLANTKYLTQRQLLAFCYVLFTFMDIITTYFGLTYYHLHETIGWTQWIINQWGWNGIILRNILCSLLVIVLFRYMPNRLFNISKYSAWVILIAYVGFTTANNLYLIMVS